MHTNFLFGKLEVIIWQNSSILSGKLPFVVIKIDSIDVFLKYLLAISMISFRANGSPPVKFTFTNDLGSFFVIISISSSVSSFINVSGLSKSIKQNEHLALHLLVKK